jgi:hypothetical protein
MLRISILLILALGIAACRPQVDAPPPVLSAEEQAERDQAIALAEGAGTGLLNDAFARLAGRPHSVREELAQLDAEGRVTAVRRRVMDVGPDTVETVATEATGTFDFGAFGRFVSFDDMDRLPANPVPYIVPDDPTYLSPQGREVYHFALAADTTIGPMRARVVTVTARPGEGDSQALRSARLYVDAASGELVGLRIHRHSQNVLFGESSMLHLMLAPGPQGAWLPAETRYTVAVRAALTATRRFRLYRAYDLAPGPFVTWSRPPGALAR